MKDNILYMFAIMPPPELSANIHHERLNFAQNYNFVRALKPPVHITLYPPFHMAVSNEAEFEQEISKIQNWANHIVPFIIELNNFGFFDNGLHPVLYISVLKSKSILQLHSGFVKELKKYIDTETDKISYKPHFTIGYRDITPDAFPAIWERYSEKKFSGSFKCDAFYLWKHDTKNWQVLKKFQLAGSEDLLLPF